MVGVLESLEIPEATDDIVDDDAQLFDDDKQEGFGARSIPTFGGGSEQSATFVGLVIETDDFVPGSDGRG